MPYPFILAANGDPVARVNPDGQWSVRWDRVLDIAYEKMPMPRRVAVTSTCKLLVAARDNFLVTPWAESEQQGNWKHFEAIIDFIDHDQEVGKDQSTISYNGDLIARINYDGSWAMKWDEIAELSLLPIDNYRAVALVAICKLFMAAKDRGPCVTKAERAQYHGFCTTPWEDK